MEFILYLLGGVTDLIVFIILLPLYPLLNIMGFEKSHAFVRDILIKIIDENGLF